MNKKIKTQKEIIKIARNLQKQGKKVVTYNGSFDILHLGHMQAIKEAKNQGDILIILLNSDTSIKMYKGPHHPVNQENVRSEILAGLCDVDYIVLFNQINPKEILGSIKPDVHCGGSDWGKNCIARSVVETNGGNIHILKWQSGFSTSNLVKKILNIYSHPETKAVFLDRDGTINVNNKPEYTYRIDDFKFVPGVILALKKLSKTGYKIIVATNQSGISRGYFKESDVRLLHAWMIKELKKNGIRIDKIYYCPHHPDDKCRCRKPEIGMFLQAVKDFGINLSKSWFIGDDQRDVIAGRNANIKTIKIGEKMLTKLKLEPNYYAKNIKEAVEIVFRNE